MRIPFLNRLRPLLSLNDPQWGRGSKGDKQDGKKPEDGPPDLDQLWRDFNQSIARMFGKNGGGDSYGTVRKHSAGYRVRGRERRGALR